MTEERLVAELDRLYRAASRAIAHVDGMDLEAYLRDAKSQDATVMCLLVVGEVSNRLAAQDPEFVESHPNWPWTEMRGFRNRAAHDYDTIKFEVVWNTIKLSLPPLMVAIEALGLLDPDDPHNAS